jgi:hypothetical protein
MFKTGWKPAFEKPGKKSVGFDQAVMLKSRFPRGQENQLRQQPAVRSRNQGPAEPAMKRKRTQSPTIPSARRRSSQQHRADEQSSQQDEGNYDSDGQEMEWVPQQDYRERRAEWGLSADELIDGYTRHLQAYPPPRGVRMRPRMPPPE